MWQCRQMVQGGKRKRGNMMETIRIDVAEEGEYDDLWQFPCKDLQVIPLKGQTQYPDTFKKIPFVIYLLFFYRRESLTHTNCLQLYPIFFMLREADVLSSTPPPPQCLPLAVFRIIWINEKHLKYSGQDDFWGHKATIEYHSWDHISCLTSVLPRGTYTKTSNTRLKQSP